MVTILTLITIVLGIIYYNMVQKIGKKPTFSPNTFDPTTRFYSLDDANQKSLVLAADVGHDFMEDLNERYDWDDFSEHDNKLWKYMEIFFDKVVDDCGIEGNDELWNALNRKQKVFWAFLAFNGDTDDGGVYQFIFNRPNFIFAVHEAFEELKLDRLKEDYKKVIDQLIGKSQKISELRAAFQNEDERFESRWNAFASGYEEFTAGDTIESYYYTRYFKRDLYKRVSDYIEENIDMFVVVHTDY